MFKKGQYTDTNSPNWSIYNSLKNELREFDKRWKHFLFADHFKNSHNPISWLCRDIVRRKYYWCWSLLGLKGLILLNDSILKAVLKGKIVGSPRCPGLHQSASNATANFKIFRGRPPVLSPHPYPPLALTTPTQKAQATSVVSRLNGFLNRQAFFFSYNPAQCSEPSLWFLGKNWHLLSSLHWSKSEAPEVSWCYQSTALILLVSSQFISNTGLTKFLQKNYHGLYF